MENSTRILIIDDDPDFLFTTGTFLERNGYEVYTAQDGPSGIRLSQEKSCQIILTDVNIPGTDGIEILKKIKENAPEKEVIIVTGYGEMELAIRSLRWGASDFLTKPINREALLKALKRGEDHYNNRKDLIGLLHLIDLLPSYLSVQDRSFKILQTNQTFRDDFGVGVGEKCYKVYKRRTEVCPQCPVEKTFQDRRVHFSEQTVPLPNGGTAQMIVYSSPILDASGNVMAVMEMSTNISKVKETQEELTFLGQSIATLSHEIKNILEGLQGGAYVVDEGLKDGDKDLTGKGWSIVKKNIVEVSNLVQNILYASKKRPLTYEPVEPGSLAKEVIGLFREKAKSMNIQIKEEINPKLPMVNLDSAAVRRMLSNLLLNALDACKSDDGKPEPAVVMRADFYDGQHFMFEVEDNGIGMEDSIRENLFTEFFSTKGADGTGLGLLVVHRIVNEHGGRIEVSSAPGKGSKIRTIFSINQS
jgi:signal transduction histidine kinase/FixJ family two-component response regulator